MSKGITIEVPVEVIEATHRIGFFKRVQKLAQECERMSEAYRKAEEELEMYGLPKRYASYGSFRKSYWQWVRLRIQRDYHRQE